MFPVVSLCILVSAILVEGDLNLPPGRRLTIHPDDEASMRQLSCSRDHPTETLTWSMEREGQSVEIWSSDHPNTTTNDDLWSVVMTDNQALLTIQATQEAAGLYICAYGSYKGKVHIFVQDSRNEVAMFPESPAACDEDTEWTCWNGECISAWMRCDGRMQCADGSDEINCFQDCTQWTCGDGQCILEADRCDGFFGCYDGSDREYCDCDEGTEWTCGNGLCIADDLRCERVFHCSDGSDEKGCVCDEATQWTCDSGQCIPIIWRCDGSWIDCTDSSDEEGCGHGTDLPIWTNTCPVFYNFHCNNGYCIPLAYQCDGIDDCPDGEDEENCPYVTGITMIEHPTTIQDVFPTQDTTETPPGETGSHIDHPLCPLPDCAFSASSSFFPCTGPDQARFNGQDAWVADPDESQPYLEIDMFRDVTVESIVTRGNGFNDEWTTLYMVAYRSEGSTWIQDPTVYFANVDANNPVTNDLTNGPISAQYWRMYPLAFVGQKALRVDLRGPLDNCQANFICPSDDTRRLPLIANPECPLPLSQITSSSSLVRCSNAIQAVLPMVAGTCDTEELTPIQSPLLCNTWIPRADDTDSFIQFDLGQLTEVFEVVTQGRGELINEFVNSYRVSYSNDGFNFNFIIDQILGQPQIFPGNTDSWSLVSNRVTSRPGSQSGRVARYWRIHPVGFTGRPGLRVELLGVRDCPSS